MDSSQPPPGLFSDHACTHPYLSPPNSAVDPTFSHFGEHASLAQALSAYQPCHDCTPATKTIIPHHHHPAGRLSGASATLDGHFCCSWLLHSDQPCFLCFQSAEALDNHIKNDHAGKDGTYRCHWQSCAKHDPLLQQMPAGPINFSNKPKLMRHVHSHTGHKPFPCPYAGCDRGFVTKEQLKNHETTHTKARRYKCEFCGKAFAVKSALTTHVAAVHREEKTHVCDVCGKAFADSSNLSKHRQTHWRERAGVRKGRARRATTTTTAGSVASGRSTPSISEMSSAGMEPETPTLGMETYTLHQHRLSSSSSSMTGSAGGGGGGGGMGFMLPPALPKHHPATLPSHACCPTDYPPLPTTSSPPFDPTCFCCDQACPAPEGPATPCPDTDDCSMAGFCDLPECLDQHCTTPPCSDQHCEAESCDAVAQRCASPHCEVEVCQDACPEVAGPMYCCEEQFCGQTGLPTGACQWDEVVGNGGPGFSELELEAEFMGM